MIEASYSPAIVVYEHVMVSAEQHPVVDGCLATFAELHDVVNFAPACGAVTVGRDASPVSCGDHHPLACVVQTLRAAQVEGCAIPVEEDGNVPCLLYTSRCV